MPRTIVTAMIALATLTACGNFDRRTSVTTTGENGVQRGYMVPANRVWDACIDVAGEAGLIIETQWHDSLGGQLVARRANKQGVQIRTSNTDDRYTFVSVSVDGGDANVAYNLHERIATRLGLSAARGGMLGGNSAEGGYAVDLKRSIDAAKRSLRAAGLTITGEEERASTARIDARTDKSVPVSISISSGAAASDLCFIVGTTKNDENAALAARLKTEFERALQTPMP
jgi:hypothetical protein